MFCPFELRTHEATLMIFEPFAPFVASQYLIKYATSDFERKGAANLRRAVFCDEQGLLQTTTGTLSTPMQFLSLR